jgi:hypothetical protein
MPYFRGSVVVVKTLYGLEGPGIEFRWGRVFTVPVLTGAGVHRSLLYNGYRVSVPGVKRPGLTVSHPPLHSTDVKDRTPPLPSWQVIRLILPLLETLDVLCILYSIQGVAKLRY